jgi:hypothetical protein
MYTAVHFECVQSLKNTVIRTGRVFWFVVDEKTLLAQIVFTRRTDFTYHLVL